MAPARCALAFTDGSFGEGADIVDEFEGLYFACEVARKKGSTKKFEIGNAREWCWLSLGASLLGHDTVTRRASRLCHMGKCP